MRRVSISAVLFDLDESLHSREESFWGWIEDEAQAAHRGGGLDHEKVAALDRRGRGDNAELLRYLAHVFGWQYPMESLLRRRQDGIASRARPFPGVPAMLARLGQRYRLGLISNGKSSMQRAKLRALGIEHLLSHVLISDEDKPDSRIFHAACRTWNLSPSSVLIVGDDPVADIQGGIAAGMQTVRVGVDGDLPSVLDLPAWLDATPDERTT